MRMVTAITIDEASSTVFAMAMQDVYRLVAVDITNNYSITVRKLQDNGVDVAEPSNGDL